ncbi:unnamed protein product [Heligmosomoides polygyrus]|uniref:KIAA0408 n=1 Tax=Heligmosomoides polygyrus TaxID=6339 RepID=A0A183GRS2_HELPZ|nr:unnamed protein product [Heligmosomoides polygyrus]
MEGLVGLGGKSEPGTWRRAEDIVQCASGFKDSVPKTSFNVSQDSENVPQTSFNVRRDLEDKRQMSFNVHRDSEDVPQTSILSRDSE